MEKNINILESVEFLAADELLVAELDKRLSFSSVGSADKACNNIFYIPCGCFGYQKPQPCNHASAVRG